MQVTVADAPYWPGTESWIKFEKIQEILQYLDIPAYSMSSCMSYSGIFHPLFSTLAITLTNCNLQLLNRHSANASQYIS